MTRGAKGNRVRTAYHEAGHAVIASVLGFIPYRVTIKPTPSLLGEVRIRVSSIIYRIPHSLKSWMIYGLAGIAAQNRYSRKWDAEDTGGQVDYLQFCDDWWKLQVMTGGQCGDHEEFQSAAYQIVRQYWYAIKPFAQLLMELETIEDDRLFDALRFVVALKRNTGFTLPEYLCWVPMTTFVDRDVTIEAQTLRQQMQQFAEALLR